MAAERNRTNPAAPASPATPAGRAMTNRRMFRTMILGAVLRRRSRAMMAVIASLVGAATLFCLAAICIAVPQQMNDEMRAYGANLIVTSTTGMDAGTVADVERLISAEGEAATATYRYESVRINAAPYVLGGIDPTQVRDLNRHWNVEGDWPSTGRVLVGRDVADALGVEVGSTITIGYGGDDTASGSASDASEGTASAGTNGMRDGRVSTDILDTSGTRFQISGVVETGGSEDDIVYALAADVDALAGTRGIDVIECSSQAAPERLATLVDAIDQAGNGAYQARQVTKMTASNQRIITMLRTLFWIVSIVVLTLTLVGVSTTMASIVSQRRNEIGLRKALGASSASVAVEFFVESALYGLVGGLVGTLLGYALARILCTAVFDRTLAFSAPLACTSVVLSILVAVIASIPPVRRATRIDPAIVLREE